jgi:hypothetical protein
VVLLLELALWIQANSGRPGWIWQESRPPSAWNEPPWTSGFGHRIVVLEDVDEDGVPELAIAAPLDDVIDSGPGRLFLVSGRSGALLAQRALPILLESLYPLECEDVDMDGDGRAERFTPSPDDGPVTVWSSRTGKPWIVLHHDDPGGYMEGFGASVAPVGDLDRDGIPEVAVGCSEFPFDRGDPYAVEIFSGRNGHRLLSIDTRARSVTVAPSRDFDADGTPDLPIGLPEEEAVYILDGETLRRRLGASRRVPYEGMVLLTLRRASYPSGAPTDPFRELSDDPCEQ